MGLNNDDRILTSLKFTMASSPSSNSILMACGNVFVLETKKQTLKIHHYKSSPKKLSKVVKIEYYHNAEMGVFETQFFEQNLAVNF